MLWSIGQWSHHPKVWHCWLEEENSSPDCHASGLSESLAFRVLTFVCFVQFVVQWGGPQLSIHPIRSNPRSRLTLAAIWSSDGSQCQPGNLSECVYTLFRTSEIRAVTSNCFQIQWKPPYFFKTEAPLIQLVKALTQNIAVSLYSLAHDLILNVLLHW